MIVECAGKEVVKFGVGDNSYQAAGGLEGINQLVTEFYRVMSTDPSAKVIFDMHPDDIDLSIKKLAYFLSGWLGGPRLYGEHFGQINIPCAHAHMPIAFAERDAWINCMQQAVAVQNYSDSFKVYLIEQLKVPAERIRQACLR